MVLVVDASALLLATIANTEDARLLRYRLRDETVHAPHLIDAEVGSVLRRHVGRGVMAPEHAVAVLQSAPLLVDHRHEHIGSIASSAWQLRSNVTFYDALYVALAQGLDVPLITADHRLANAPDLPCTVETVSPPSPSG